MKKQNFTLAIVKTEAQNLQKQSWDSFHRDMINGGITEAIIIPTDREATDVNLAKRVVISHLMKNNDVNHSADYAVIDHSDDDRLLPCLVLFDPELQFSVITALQFNPYKYFIQAVISETDNELHVNKCPFSEYDDQFNDLIN